MTKEFTAFEKGTTGEQLIDYWIAELSRLADEEEAAEAARKKKEH